MDARQRLRIYLEQRRETGETELVLDTLSVDDVMRLLGVRAEAGAADGAPSDQGARRAQARDPQVAEPRRREVETTETSDWRAALRATGAQPGKSDEPPAKDTPIAPAPAAKPPGTRYTFGPPDDAPPQSMEPLGPRPSAPGPGGAAAQPTLDALKDLPHGIVVGATTSQLFESDIARLASLQAIAEMVEKCTRCVLHKTAKRGVPGEGNPNADLVCVGEAPGQNEDEQGRPFVGQAGQLLNKILGAINLQREDVFICNVLKHRPPGNRNPLPDEVSACSPYLVRQLELIKPKVILAFGTFAAQTLLGTNLSLGKLRGSIHHYYGVPLIVTYHPAALLRNPSWKRPTWEDVQLARRLLDRASGD